MFPCLSLCLSVGSGPWVGRWEWVVEGLGRGLSTVRGKWRWQVEVKAEQFSTVGVEVGRGTGVKETAICPKAWTIPTILRGFPVSVTPNRKKNL